jgi:Tfp pilus assembly PilM family ATPase
MSIGIDIGRYQIKIVQLQKTPKGYTLQNFGTEPVYDKKRDYDPERLDEDKIIEAAERLLDRMKINPRRAKLVTTGEKYEVHHGVEITDPAIIAAVTYSTRYIPTDNYPIKPLI